MPRVRQKTNIYRAQDFAKAVKMRLVELDLEQHDLAQEMGVSDATVSLMLKDANKISADRLRTMVQYLQLDPEILLKFCGYCTNT